MSYRDLALRLSKNIDTLEAKAILRLVLEDRFHLSWSDVLCGGVDHLDDNQQRELDGIIRLIEDGNPVQYVLGEAEFYGRMFHVAPGVLVPRPETEVLIEQLVDDSRHHLRVLDIGTGSGCIAVTLALQHPDWQIEAWDISLDALSIAKQNAARLGASNVLFLQQDVLNTSVCDSSFDVIVSNPPYICERERAEMESVVLDHEPSLALFVPDDDPLLFYRHITRLSRKHLSVGGVLMFEINRAYGNEVCRLMESHGFTDVVVVKDQYDNDRVVKGHLR